MRHLLHKAIVWYLRRCGGAFHCYAYGPPGRYVKLMTDEEYSPNAKLREPTGQPNSYENRRHRKTHQGTRMNRRSLIRLLAAVPFLGWLAKPSPPAVVRTRWFVFPQETSIKTYRGYVAYDGKRDLTVITRTFRGSP